MKKCPNCEKIYADYDQYCFVCRYKLKHIEGSQKMEYCPDAHDTSELDALQKKPEVTCPYCKSTNTKKITMTSKAVHTAIFGLFGMSRNAKQWHCNSCGSEF